MIKKTKEHLESVNESYFEHFTFAFQIFLLCLKAGFGILFHALCPAVFQTTGSRTIIQMHNIMMARIGKHNDKS